MRAFSRLLFHVSRMLLFPLDGRFSRLYMFFYSRLLSIMGVKLRGKPRYISSSARFDDFSLMEIGDRVVVSKNVVFLTHDYSITTGLVYSGDVSDSDFLVKQGISIGRNVFIGMGSLILPGVTIGDNVIIGAGSVVRGRIESDCIALGNPCVIVASMKSKVAKWKGKWLLSTN
jgi:acetyltransferase-like isoleucine patch superfamily enzyme